MNYSKTTKLKLSAMCSKINVITRNCKGNPIFFLPIMYMKKSQKVRTDEFWQRAFKLFVLCICVTTLHSCYNFAFMLHENALLFSPSEMHHFLLAKKLWYCVGGVCFQRHCDAVSVVGIARLLGFINWLDNLNWPP